MQLTNPREIIGFFLAHCFRIAFFVLMAYTAALTPLYVWAAHTGGQGLPVVFAFGIALVLALVMLPLFLVARGALGGTPGMVSGVGGERAITTTGAEIGAYLLAQLVGIVVAQVLFILVLSPLLATPLYRSGYASLWPVITSVVGLVIAAVVFVMFVSLRGGRFGGAIATGISKYVTFRGRANRAEYWYWVLFVTIVAWPIALIEIRFYRIPALAMLFDLAMILPSLAVAVRRLHDSDRSGWFVLTSLIPFVGSIVLIVLLCLGGTPGSNRFGEATV